MSEKTTISWTNATFNPVTGCTKVSPGCDHCYAEALTNRFHGLGAFDTVTLHPERLEQPLHWKQPRRIFVNSMSDLFHREIPRDFLDQVFAVMALAKWHRFQVLTKRPHRMLHYLTRDVKVVPSARSASRATCIGWAAQAWAENHGVQKNPEMPWDYQFPLPKHVEDIVLSSSIDDWLEWPLPNIWLGVSVENQKFADNRIPALLRIPAKVRFLSCEPLLGPIDLTRFFWPLGRDAYSAHNPPPIHWVITGGESGPNRRPANPDWFRDIRDQCLVAGIPFFHKQGNASRPGQDRLLDGRIWEEYPA